MVYRYNLPVRFFALILAFAFSLQSPKFVPDPPHECDACPEWNKPREPLRVAGNTYYVGTEGLSALLVTGKIGHILLDAGLSQSAPLIVENIRKLGFKPEDIKMILVSHGHFDHAGGVRALQRFTGARVAASASTAEALKRGENTPDDPQFGFGKAFNGFPAVKDVLVLADQQEVRVPGAPVVVAHMIPGHSPGSTAYTWHDACVYGEENYPGCLNMVYADSLTSVSAPGFRYGNRLELFRRSIEKVAALPCDIVLSPHPQFTQVDEKLKRRAELKGKGRDPFIDPNGCRAYAAAGMKQLAARILEESK